MIPFLKMHGLGNDFLVLDRRREQPPLPDAAQIRRLADRRRGIGFDQLILLEPAAQGSGLDGVMRILNADGSPAGACGNATRCLGRLLLEEAPEREQIRLQGPVGILECRRGPEDLITADLGPARFDWQSIPLAEPADTGALDLDLPGLPPLMAASMGNPHAVALVPDAEVFPLAILGPRVEHHPLFPQRTNFEVVSPLGPDWFRVRVWERGAGITPACGSGACAVAALLHAHGFAGRRIRLSMDGGDLWLERREGDEHLLMTGPATLAYTGTIAAELLQ